MEKFAFNLFEIEIFCNIINVFTVTFDQFNVLNSSVEYNDLKNGYQMVKH